jgi:Cu(I)/Ag(I) efflux system membrane protein CusA/SilA
LVKGIHEAVGGVVVARYGVSTVEVLRAVKEKIRALQAGLPPGVRIVECRVILNIFPVDL